MEVRDKYPVKGRWIGNRREVQGPWDAIIRCRNDGFRSKVLFALDCDMNDYYHEFGRDYHASQGEGNFNWVEGPFFLKPRGAGIFWMTHLWR
jgi:hypothetical protein